MQFKTLLSAGSLLAVAIAQSTTSSASGSSASSSPSSNSTGYSGSPRGAITEIPTDSRATYLTYSSTVRVTSTSRPAVGSIISSRGVSFAGNATRSSNATMSSSSTTTTTNPQTLLGGTVQTSAASGNASSQSGSRTATAAQPINTTPCNNYPELCNRRYSNITGVAAHNSAFHVPGNSASNQKYDSITQLNDGVRLLQTETHWPNETVYLCHSSCDILNAGSLESWLTELTEWVAAHPYDVITLLIGNQEFKDVSLFVPAFQDSGITRYVYTPSVVPMTLNDWPTLAQMILTQQRVVVFMDYDADQTKVPWILDQFSQMWETPFNPTNNLFPCTIQRPPGLLDADARTRLYLLNNNLNTELTLLGNSLLVPTTTLLNVTNAANGTGSLGQSTRGCVEDWNRPPNWLDVDYYNVGNGSVFEVAAKWNNVTYNRPCCGADSSITSGATMLEVAGRMWLGAAAFVVATCWLML